MESTLKANPSLDNHMLRTERLVFRFSIGANATPANKTLSVEDLSCAYLRTQGQTAAADAVETITWTAPVDNNAGDSVFGILVDMDGSCDKVLQARVTEITSLETSHTTLGPNASTSVDKFVTAEGNIAIEIAATGLNLASESPTYVVEIDYLEAR